MILNIINFTEKERDVAVGIWEWVRRTSRRKDEKWTVDSSSKPRTMSMPPKCTFLSLNCKPVSVAWSRSDWTLGHKFRSVSPTGSHLPHTVPVGSHTKPFNIDDALITASEYGLIVFYQWIVMLYRARFMTLTTSVSPLLTTSIGPGNIPLTVMLLCVSHSLFTFVACICMHKYYM